MDFNDSEQEATFRETISTWLQEHAPRHLLDELRNSPPYTLELKNEDTLTSARAWQLKKFQAGYSCRHWPSEFGGHNATPIERIIWEQEEGEYGKLSLPFGIGMGMVAPTLIHYASTVDKQRFLPAIASGEEIWCQLFSEPGAGSDLAGINTRAERDGDNWRINGQKVWTSWAHVADYGILLARSDSSVPKHKGLTMFFVDMKAAGIDIKPIHQMNEKSVFNEIFLTDVIIPDQQRLGDVGDGWRVSLTTLMHERLASAGIPTGFQQILDLCCETGLASQDQAVRSKLAHWAYIESGLRFGFCRSLTRISRGEEPGAENAIGKLVGAQTLQDILRYGLNLKAESGLCMTDVDDSGNGWFQSMFLRSPGLRIEAGTDEILKNIIAEHVLGLPGDLRVDKDIPFNQL